MASFVPQIASSDASQMLRLAAGVNSALRGETSITGLASAEAGSSTLTVQDSRCRAGRLAILIPLDAQAAGLSWHLSAMTRGSMTFTFSSAPASQASFGWALLGDGYVRGQQEGQ